MERPLTERPLTERLTTRCCIAGGGPAGIMLGFLLARANIDVVVLEKWPDFFRDFRGDTIHPSTMEVLRELGLLTQFLQLPHSETRQVTGLIGGAEIVLGDFTHLPVACPYIAMIPQWDFLKFIVAQAKAYPAFHLHMETEATDLITPDERIGGVYAMSPAGDLEIRADLVIGADGRHSTVREKSGLLRDDFGAPIDVLWFRLSRHDHQDSQSFGYVNDGKFMVMINRDTYWQCAFVIAKGTYDGIKARGLDAFRNDIATLVPSVAAVVSEIESWDNVKLLAVAVDHLRKWYRPGLICIGDAAHAMSPVGGVGINLAIQDAVAAANILIPAFQRGGPTVADLARIQRRRSWPARMTQRAQVFIHQHVLAKVLRDKAHLQGPPWPLRVVSWFPFLRRVTARAIGLGVRPEHIAH